MLCSQFVQSSNEKNLGRRFLTKCSSIHLFFRPNISLVRRGQHSPNIEPRKL